MMPSWSASYGQAGYQGMAMGWSPLRQQWARCATARSPRETPAEVGEEEPAEHRPWSASLRHQGGAVAHQSQRLCVQGSVSPPF